MNSLTQPLPVSPPNDALPVIRASNINFAFGEGELRKQILFDVSLDVAAGEIVLLTGPSGSGKTTLLTLIGALRTVREGELTVLQRPLHRATTADLIATRRGIGFIFQQHNLLEFLTARQNVELVFELHPQFSASEVRSKSQQMLEDVGLGSRLDYHPAQDVGWPEATRCSRQGARGQSQFDSGG